jgi:hypothetical protein
MRLELMAPVYRLRGGRVGSVVILVGPTACRVGHFFGPICSVLCLIKMDFFLKYTNTHNTQRRSTIHPQTGKSTYHLTHNAGKS